jgi:exosortase
VRNSHPSTKPPARSSPDEPSHEAARDGGGRWSILRLAGTAVLTGAAILLALDAWRDIAHIAMRDEEASQVLLAPLACAWLLWSGRDRLRGLRPANGWVGSIMIAAGWLLTVLGDWGLWQAVWHAGAVLMVLGALFTGLGATTLRRCLPAVLVLMFLVPVPLRIRQRIAAPMQQQAASLTELSLQTGGVDVQRSGSALVIGGRTVNVAEACNGLRMVFSLFLVAYAFAFAQPLNTWARLALLALSPVLAVIFNVVRMVPVVWLYGQYPGEFAQRVHDLSGWLMLLIAWFTLMGIVKCCQWAMASVPTGGAVSAPRPPEPAGAPQRAAEAL